MFKAITLPDGTRIPAGTLVNGASYAMHHDEGLYPSPDDFDPFRFAKMRHTEGEGTKHQYVNTSTEYIHFGHGRHAWYVFRAHI